MADITDIQKFYADLLILQYHSKPKAINTIKLLTGDMVCNGLYQDLQTAYDLDSAVGVQLDIIGKIVGCYRNNLADENYRKLLKFKIVLNNLRATIGGIDKAIYDYFGNDVVAYNNKNMTMSYVINDDYDDVIQTVVDLGYLPSPLAVGYNITSVPSANKLWGFNDKYITGNAVGFSDKTTLREGTFLTQSNIIGAS